MILDILENAHRYLDLNKGFAEAIEFLLRPGLEELPTGRYEIDGERVYASISMDHGRQKKDALLETHEKYIDIQLVLTGTDNMGWKPKSACKKPCGDYNINTDAQLFYDEPDLWLPVKAGSFAIFFQEDAHMPMISNGQLHKVVVKVALSR